MNKLSRTDTLKVGLTMFALFFGAGNMIFPPLIGQQAGTNTWITLAGFLITGVGLPYLGVIAVTMSGSQLQDLAGRANPLFGLFFTFIVYLSIGPLFGVPRTATVSYEIGVSPFISESSQTMALALFSIIFFTITAWLSLKPSKLVDRFGNILTPALLIIVALIVIVGIFNPVGTIGEPQEPFVDNPFIGGFIEGYGTMDAIAGLVFAIIVIHAIKAKGITAQKEITKITVKAGLVAVAGLSVVYIALAYLGTTSRAIAAGATNGGDILATLAYELMGTSGLLLLGIAVILACLTTAVGLVSACSTFLVKILPLLSYSWYVLLICTFTTVLANVGLTQLISITIPVLVGVYPLAIVLITFRLFNKWFHGYSEVYSFALLAAGVIGLTDMLQAFGISLTPLVKLLSHLPLYEQGIGWIVPAVVFGAIGYGVASLRNRKEFVSTEKNAVFHK